MALVINNRQPSLVMEPLDRNSQLQWHDEHKVIRLSTDHERSHHSM